MKIDLDQIKNKILPVLKEAQVSRAAFFGSYVRGEEREDSDIDILVDLPKGKSLFEFIDLELKLGKVLGKKVDLIEYSTIKPRLKPYILGNQIQII